MNEHACLWTSLCALVAVLVVLAVIGLVFVAVIVFCGGSIVTGWVMGSIYHRAPRR